MSTESTDLDLHFAAPPPDSAEPGEGVRYLLDQAAFLADLPARINFRIRVRMLLREGRFGEALLAALAYDARTVQLRGADGRATDERATGSPVALHRQPVPDSDAPHEHPTHPHRLPVQSDGRTCGTAESGTADGATPINPLDQSWR